MFLPARRTFLLLVAGGLIVALSPALGLAVDCGALLLLGMDAWLARSMGAPELDLFLPARVGQEDETPARVVLSNRAGRAVEGRITLDIPPVIAGAGAHRPRGFKLGPSERLEIEFPIVARARGLHIAGAVHLRLLGPLRLAWWQRKEAPGREIEVIPGLREVRSYRLLALHHHLQQAGLRNVRQRGGSGAFESLREYARGDDPRRIDWKASARRGTHIVREYEMERSQNIMLCIDMGRHMVEIMGKEDQEHGAHAGRSRLDKALASAVVLSEVARVWNDHVGVFAFSDRVHVVLPAGRYPPDRLPAIFTTLEARSVEPDYPRALVRLSRVVSRRSLLVFFGDVIDDEVSSPLATQLARLARRHLPLFIAMRNRDLFAAAQAPVREREEAYARAAATELVLARARTLARMRERGILIADVLPDAAVAACVNRYIEIKRRGAL
jgi:uncharacterized protein (DUF58 family)